jgi:hypothetical protein
VGLGAAHVQGTVRGFRGQAWVRHGSGMGHSGASGVIPGSGMGLPGSGMGLPGSGMGHSGASGVRHGLPGSVQVVLLIKGTVQVVLLIKGTVQVVLCGVGVWGCGLLEYVVSLVKNSIF